MKHNLETWNDEQTTLVYLKVTPAHLHAWRRAGKLTFVTGVMGRMYSKEAINHLIVWEWAAYAKAVSDTKLAAQNEAIRRTQMSLDL